MLLALTYFVHRGQKAGGLKSIAQRFDNVVIDNVSVFRPDREGGVSLDQTQSEYVFTWRVARFSFDPPIQAGERRTVIIEYDVNGAVCRQGNRIMLRPRWLHQFAGYVSVGATRVTVGIMRPAETSNVLLHSPRLGDPGKPAAGDFRSTVVADFWYETLPSEVFCFDFDINDIANNLLQRDL